MIGSSEKGSSRGGAAVQEELASSPIKLKNEQQGRTQRSLNVVLWGQCASIRLKLHMSSIV